MFELSWSWLAAPYVACALMMFAVAFLASIVRGDRVIRLGVVGAATTTLPWALASSVAACTQDPEIAMRFLRLGQGPVALVGPNLLLVLLGVSGQLERHRWVARLAIAFGVSMMAVCWSTDLVVPGVQRLSSGMLYFRPGPLTNIHVSQLALWLAVGIFVVRRSSTRGEKKRLISLLIAVLALGTIGSMDMLVVHGIFGSYPIGWLPALVAGAIAIYLVRKTDLLRPQGYDRNAWIESLAFAITVIGVAVATLLLRDAEPLTYVLIATTLWGAALTGSWAIAEQRPVRVAGERALEEFVSRLADIDDEKVVTRRLGELWSSLGIAVRAIWRAENAQLLDVTTGETRPLDPELAAWLVRHGQTLAPTDLATMKLGPLRARVEALVTAHGATLLVPLIDRDTLVGLVEADHGKALREEEHGFVLESSRATARAVTYAALARSAATEGATAREVEVAEAMRLQASASRDDELGRWTVAAEYRTAPHTTGAGWSATLLADGRLALMVTEAQAHGVPAALATAALTGAFAAATTSSAAISLDDLVTSLRASTEGVMRGGEPIAAFLAILDAERQSVAWACAGHPGAHVVGPVAYDLSSFPGGSGIGQRPMSTALGGGGAALGASMTQATRGESKLPHDSLLVIASTAVRGDDEQRWEGSLREHAPAGPRLATVLVDSALRRGGLHEDFLVVVVRQRPDRPSGPMISR
ncbi:MAG: SpoIIE family protein phosphatase [Deltaproteobacteria bacterium]|nr:SpoIIE family protein phosphatase [Deltaproteobacteria bacterium]